MVVEKLVYSKTKKHVKQINTHKRMRNITLNFLILGFLFFINYGCFPYQPKDDFYEKLIAYQINGQRQSGNEIKINK
jgi:hypothetical protein